MAYLVDCVPLAEARKRPGLTCVEGPWCWLLERPIIFSEPVPYRGMPGLFQVDLLKLSPKAFASLGLPGPT